MKDTAGVSKRRCLSFVWSKNVTRSHRICHVACYAKSAFESLLRGISSVRHTQISSQVMHERPLLTADKDHKFKSCHSDQKSGVVRFPIFLYLYPKISWNLAFSQYKEWACPSLLQGLNKPIFRLWPHVWPLAEIFGWFSAIKSANWSLILRCFFSIMKSSNYFIMIAFSILCHFSVRLKTQFRNVSRFIFTFVF